ncbi:hypothetical protein [uncultured Microbacterium sp.]|uniref:hypothetical protein n=1 Tax=uncultured Microbacterium sp. TaxID=191216 RepID=UPI0025D2E6CC|nr:hypothetical protein [uncultured Microbacterium sp.]
MSEPIPLRVPKAMHLSDALAAHNGAGDCPPGSNERSWSDMDAAAAEAYAARVLGSTAPVHWVGDAPTSLHGNGAASFNLTTRAAAKVTCSLCLTLLDRESSGS